MRQPTSDEKYQSALLESLNLLAENKLQESLASLKKAQAEKDTDEIRLQIDKVQALVLDQITFDQSVANIQALIDLGQSEEAAQVAFQAIAQFDDDNQVLVLSSLKRQAEALTSTRSSDSNRHMARYRAEAETAAKERNLRAALLSLELALAVKPDSAIQNQADALRTRLSQYDEALSQARQLRRDPQTLEQAIAAYQQAMKAWETEQAKSELADAQLALHHRRDRIAVATFETGANSELAAVAAAFADELLPFFKRRYDLVDRTLIHRLLDELKVRSEDIALSQEGRLDLSRLAQARYLVVGSISPLSGVTVYARLIDLRTGLVVQTGKIVAGTPEDASRKLPQLAAMLMLSDEEMLAFERQQAQTAAPSVVNAGASLPAVPVYNSQSPPVSINYSATKPPAYGALQLDEFDRLPSIGSSSINTVQMTPIEQERPLRQRLLAVQIELGDNLFHRGRSREALERYQLARELDPANLDILARINNCLQYLPPATVQSPVRASRREKMAFLNFFVAGDPRVLPTGLSTWVPEHLMPYYSSQFDIVDRGEVYWMMGRLGLTLSDVIKESAVRRWLGRALNARYLVTGSLQQAGGINLTISLLDTEEGWEASRTQLVASDVHDLKLSLPEVARLSLLNTADRVQREKEEAWRQAEYLRAQEALRRGQYSLALEIGKSLSKSQPFNIRINVFLSQVQEQSRFYAWDQARLNELRQQRQQRELVSRRQAEMILVAERLRHEAYLRAAQIAESERTRQREQARQQLLTQARSAVQRNKLGLSLELLEAALALSPGDAAILRETAQVRAAFESTRRQGFLELHARQEEANRRQHDTELTAGRLLWTNDRKRLETPSSLQVELRQHDAAEYNRLVEQAQRLKTQGRIEQSAALLQTARRLNPSAEVERLLADTLLDEARAIVRSRDAAQLAELERKLAQESVRRKQVELESERNWALYQTTVRQAQEAQRGKKYELALSKSQEAMRLFRTEEAADLWRQCQAQLDSDKREQATRLKEAREVEKRKAELVKLLATAKTAEQSRRFDEAIASLRRAREIEPGNVEVITALTRLENAGIKSLMDQKAQAARDKSSQVKGLLSQAQTRTDLRQYEAALSILEAAQKLAPGDQQITAKKDAIRKLQDAQAQALVEKQKKEEEARKQFAQRIEAEEKAKQQSKQAREQAEASLNGGDLKAAETALAGAIRLAPRDPAVLKLQQELARAKTQAARVQVQADAKAKIEAMAQSKLSATVKEQQGRINDLLKLAQAAIGKKDFSAAEKHIGDALAIDSTNLAAGRVQRELQAARQAEEKAKSAMSSADRKKQEEETAKKKVEFTQHMKEGKEALAAEDFEKAAKSFTAAKALNPEDPDAALFLGMANRNSDRAKAEAEMARKEEEAKKKREMENAKVEADAKKKAEEEFRRKLAMDAEAKKRADALKALSKEQFDKSMTDGKQALANKRYDDAIKLFEKAAQLMPDDKDALSQLSLARKEKSQAMEAGKQAQGKSPPVEKMTTAQLVTRARSLQAQKKWNEALTVFRQALAQSPNDPAAKKGAAECEFQVHLDAGASALAKKDKQAAIKSLEAALKLDPGHAEAQKLLKQARELK